MTDQSKAIMAVCAAPAALLFVLAPAGSEWEWAAAHSLLNFFAIFLIGGVDN